MRHQELIDRLIRDIGIPPRFNSKTFDDYETTLSAQRTALSASRDFVEHFNRYRSAGRCLLFLGKLGTGKTHLACAICREVAQSGQSAHYTTVSQLIRRIRATWNNGATETESDILRQMERFQLLVLDEVGVQRASELEVTQLSEIVDLRYRAQKPTLVISNHPLNDLAKFLGARAVDRLRENDGKVIYFDWESRRGDASRRSAVL
jgi:DNA replication protein DnaC